MIVKQRQAAAEAQTKSTDLMVWVRLQAEPASVYAYRLLSPFRITKP